MMRHTLMAVTVSLGLLSMSGCAENPADSKPKATVGEASDAAKPAASPQQGKPNTAAPTKGCDKNVAKGTKALKGKIIFIGSKVTGNHITEFTDWVGGASASNDITKTALSFCVNTNEMIADIDAKKPGNPKFEKKLRSHHFFDVEKHPTATFASTKISTKAQGSATHEVTGDLTIKGIAKSITFPATIKASDSTFNMTAEFSINRKDFKITYKGKPDDLIRDDVLLKLTFDG